MPDGDVKYYILFVNYEQGMKLHDLLDAHSIKNRIAPVPRAIQGRLSCGMCLLIEPEHIEETRSCIEEHQAEHFDIVPLEVQLKSHRDRYC